jgi:adenine-specific DNA-methyltransferase
VALTDEQALADVAARLGAARVSGWSVSEQRLVDVASAGSVRGGSVRGGPVSAGAVYGGAVAAGSVSGDTASAGYGSTDGASDVFPDADGAVRHDVAAIRAQIRAGEDPLGEAFCRVRPSAERRAAGQTFTPKTVIESMIRWAARTVEPARVVDPGVGSARFLVAAGRRWPDAVLLGVETDPLAAMIGRANLAAAGMADRATITLTDYRSAHVPPAAGPTLFLGNPPYVRHHQVPAAWKDWLRSTAASLRLPASGLAGLHAHFFLATALHAVPGDAGVLVTAAEWLDVNYGALVRALLLGPLGGEAIHVLDPATAVFADAATTSVITCFRPGARPASMRLRQVASAAGLGELTGGAVMPVATLRAAPRWRVFASHRAAKARGLRSGQVELGELCRVHRGQVTGANRVWIARADQTGLPGGCLFHAVTRASELFQAAGKLATMASLRCVIDLPAGLDELSAAERPLVEEFLVRARAAGAADSYIARHRDPWWRVRLGPPAPILATYMARRPPAFVRNLAGARHVNIAHGLYPREPLSGAALDGLAAFLRQSVVQEQGRTYAGGLTKFEPREMERLPVPRPHLLAGYASVAASPVPTS